MNLGRSILLMLVLVSLGSTTRRPALADEPTPASVFERTSAAANQTSAEAKKTSDSLKAYQDRLKHAQAEAAAAGSALSNALGNDPEPLPQAPLEDIEVEPVIKSVVKRPAAKPRPTTQPRPSGDLFSADATIVGPDQIETGEGGEYRLSVPTTKLVWKVYPSRMILRQDNGRLIFFAGKVERTYTLLAVYLDTSGELSEAEKVVTVGAPTPPGPPVPPPDPPKPPGPPTPPPIVPVYPVPSAEMQGIVGPVKTIGPTILPEDRSLLAGFYSEFGSIVVANPAGIVKSTQLFRDAHVRGLDAMFQGRLKGKYPGLGEAVNKAIADALGPPSASAMDAATRQRATDVCKALAWAVGT